MIWAPICLLVLGVAAAPYAAERRRLVMDDDARTVILIRFYHALHGLTGWDLR